jgi:putative two-component system hydrogenase maturation factor HypX/HoxX
MARASGSRTHRQYPRPAPSPARYAATITLCLLFTVFITSVTQRPDRAVDWTTPISVIAQQIRSADRQLGVLDEIAGQSFYLHGAHEEDELRGEPGQIIAWRGDAVCRATGDGAVWITHLRAKHAPPGEQSFKLPATHVLREYLSQRNLPEAALPICAVPPARTYRDIWYEERNGVGYLFFEFHNGAMSTEHCQRLLAAYVHARQQPTKVIVLMGGIDVWSNGIHLNVIEAAEDCAGESWRNINAMNDLVREIISTDSHLVVSALAGNAGAGGVILALGAGRVVAHSDVILNPHYRSMGGLYGSEYWTYLLPKRVGADMAIQLTSDCKPLGTKEALRIGLIDAALGANARELRTRVRAEAEAMAAHPNHGLLLEEKRRQRAMDERAKPLSAYRQEELARMHENFYGADRSYHVARRRFVRKLSSAPRSAPSSAQLK